MRILVIFILAAGCAACASVTRGWNEDIQFDSVPSGAEVRTTIKGPCSGPCPAVGENQAVEPVQTQAPAGPACTTPCIAKIRRSDTLIATFTKPGYRSETVEIGTRVAGAGAVGMAGNVLIGGVIGVGVDAASGAALEHYPNPVVVTLHPLASPQAPPRLPRGQPLSKQVPRSS